MGRRFQWVLSVFAGLVFSVCFAATSHAQCIPGIPCAIPFTPSDHLHPDHPISGNPDSGPGNNRPDGPNVPVTAPPPAENNYTKLDRSTNTAGSHACDADFMNQIYANSFLQAERDVMMSELLVRKPDSVLEYSCFDQHAALSARFVGPLFTERRDYENYGVTIDGRFGDVIALHINVIAFGLDTSRDVRTQKIDVSMGDTYHDRSIEQLVLGSLQTYVNQNFSHSYLGGATTADNTLNFTEPTIGNICPMMFEVFYAAKCLNLNKDLSFWTFENFRDIGDFRVLPGACPVSHQITDDIIALAENRDQFYAQYDDIDAQLDLMRTGLVPGGCAPPIPTGVTTSYEVYGTDLFSNRTVVANDTWDDGVCPNPGCSLAYGGTRCF